MSRRKKQSQPPRKSPHDRTRPADAPGRAAANERAADPTPHDVARSWSQLGDLDLHLFNEGRYDRAYEKLGAHPHRHDGQDGTSFAVWAPGAREVSVIGEFNGWEPAVTPLQARGNSGIWEGFVPGVGKGALYKYHIHSQYADYRVNKADPYGYRHERPPRTASVVWDHTHEWHDQAWLERRARSDFLHEPMSTYELHLGSWARSTEGEVSYRGIADRLIDHVTTLGFTHVEFMPLMEHPFEGSWGYQVTGFFAPTSRFGEPQDLMYLIDRLHQAGIGVILDWVPSHFPLDEHGLAFFDGTYLFEHADPKQGFHPDWKTAIFNFGRREVVSFLISSARMWLERFHIDGLRVDAVASMLYLDYSREQGDWIPNEYGGRENLEAIRFLRQLNELVGADFPGVLTIAEESTAWPMVTKPTSTGGLGFHLKWDMGWMHDTLRYLQRDTVHRKYHHADLTFRGLYAWNENYVLPLSHDEVVHGKGSLLGKMTGDEWQRFANLRALYTMMFATPGKKLLFMGAELAPWTEWNHDAELEWHLREQPLNGGIQALVSDLNRLYRQRAALHDLDCDHAGFRWLDVENAEHSICITLRQNRDATDQVVVAMNFTEVPRHNYRVGVPRDGRWVEIFNSDIEYYGGSGMGNLGGVEATPMAWHDQPVSVNLLLPPLAVVMLAHAGDEEA